MKKIILLFIVMSNIALLVNAQIKENQQTPFIGQYVSAFKAVSTTGDINFPDDFYSKWKILFSHPADFTPVCSSEIIALAENQKEFYDLNTAIIVISTDGLNSHIEWVKSLEAIKFPDKKIKIDFPLISDVNMEISKKFNLLNPEKALRKDIRAVIFIDTENKIRAIMNYPENIGRNIEEILRVLKALQLADDKMVLTPANWNPGSDVLIPSPKSLEESEKLKLKNSSELYSLTWYLWYKKL